MSVSKATAVSVHPEQGLIRAATFKLMRCLLGRQSKLEETELVTGRCLHANKTGDI